MSFHYGKSQLPSGQFSMLPTLTLLCKYASKARNDSSLTGSYCILSEVKVRVIIQNSKCAQSMQKGEFLNLRFLCLITKKAKKPNTLKLIWDTYLQYLMSLICLLNMCQFVCQFDSPDNIISTEYLKVRSSVKETNERVNTWSETLDGAVLISQTQYWHKILIYGTSDDANLG